MSSKAEMNAWLVTLGVAAEKLMGAAAAIPGARAVAGAVAGTSAGPVKPAEVNTRVRNANARPDEDENIEPATPMALDDGKGGAKPLAKPKDKKIDFAPEVIESHVGEIKKEPLAVGTLMKEIKTQSDVNIIKMHEGIAKACKDFQRFTEDKIEALKHQEELDKMALDVVKTVAVAVTGGLGGIAIEGELAKEVIKTTIEVVGDVIAKKAEQAIDNSSKGFEKLVGVLVEQAEGSKAQFEKIVKDRVYAVVDPIANAVANGQTKTLNAKQLRIFDAFSAASPSEVDKVLERVCGIPTEKRSNLIQLNLYQGMVEKFMQKYVRATNEGKLIEWGMTGEDRVLAHRAAVHETNEKQKAYGYNFDEN